MSLTINNGYVLAPLKDLNLHEKLKQLKNINSAIAYNIQLERLSHYALLLIDQLLIANKIPDISKPLASGISKIKTKNKYRKIIDISKSRVHYFFEKQEVLHDTFSTLVLFPFEKITLAMFFSNNKNEINSFEKIFKAMPYNIKEGEEDKDKLVIWKDALGESTIPAQEGLCFNMRNNFIKNMGSDTVFNKISKSIDLEKRLNYLASNLDQLNLYENNPNISQEDLLAYTSSKEYESNINAIKEKIKNIIEPITIEKLEATIC